MIEGSSPGQAAVPLDARPASLATASPGWALPWLMGALGGMLAALGYLSIGPLTSGETVLGLGRELLWITPLGLVLIWVSLHRLHGLHQGETSGLERWGFRHMAIGLAIPIFVALLWGPDYTVRPTGAAILGFLGAIALRLGLLGFAIGLYRAQRLSSPARGLLLVAAVALILSFGAGFARAEAAQAYLSASAWLLWTGVCALGALN